VDLALKTHFSSAYVEIHRLREWIGHLADVASMSPVDVFDLRIAAIEAFIHIIEEAYEGDQHGVVKATLLLRGGEVRLVLRDYGRKLATTMEEDACVPGAGGANLFLIRRLVDEVKFHTSLPRGTAVEILKRFERRPSAERGPGQEERNRATPGGEPGPIPSEPEKRASRRTR
jgi:anti-sigma regulatory factor (Ser/Thr protein kinase)